MNLRHQLEEEEVRSRSSRWNSREHFRGSA